MIVMPDEHSQQKSLIEQAFAEWAPGSTVTLSSIAPGRSGSSLFKADVRGAPIPGLRSGQYILKTSMPAKWADQEDEITAHKRSYDWNADFSQEHIPQLVKHFPNDAAQRSADGYVMLFEIAGRSLDMFSTTNAPQDGLFFDSAEGILSSILKAWTNSDVDDDKTPDRFLADLYGYRLDKEKAPALHSVCDALSDGQLHFVVGGEVLVNPLKLVEFLKNKGAAPSPVLRGLNHGDLHGGNILVHRMQPCAHPFWVIDFALSALGPIGYDAAYLELSHALAALGDEDPALFVGALRSGEDPADTSPLPGGALWTKELIRRMRRTLAVWVDGKLPYRSDDINRQLALCRVAAGVNWANKPVKDSWRKAAICYAGWAARQYLKTHKPELWKDVGPTHKLVSKRDLPSAADHALWAELWQATNGFDASAGKFVLVTEGLNRALPLRALGQLPWTAVIDLDPKSDVDGLHRQAGPLLAARRGVHLFTADIPTIDLRRGTGWMMASGWAAKSEYFPDYNEWRWERLPVVRDFARQIAQATSPERLQVVVLPGATLDQASPMARINAIVGAIDEATKGRALIHILGGRAVGESAKNLSSIPLTTDHFLAFLTDTFGTSFSAHIAEIPGPDGKPRAIPLEVLRPMQENLDVLHSSILSDQSEYPGKEGAFWRGRPPTWAELNAGLDIERVIHHDLIRTLSEKLETHRNQTVVLNHSPGAGGTTTALRAAWELRTRYPVAILSNHSDSLPHRVRELFHLAERPVLLVAESADLTESGREDLYRYFAQHNCRVVLLYLRRTLTQVDDAPLSLTGSMTKKESASFFTVYSALTNDQNRVEQLKQITYQDTRERYRLPFFYGLMTFEREFLGIDKYVESHLGQARKTARDMLEYLALVTIYSNSGIPISLLKAMMGVDPQSSLTIEDLLGAGPARLVISRNGNLRFMHQMIAEKVLAHFHGGGPLDGWHLDLKTYAIEFIRDAVSASGPEALRTLFRQMFVDRLGGVDGAEDREEFAPLIESLDSIDKTLGHAVLETLAQECPEESHFWSHLGRHQVYRLRRDYEKAEEYLLRAIKLNPNDALHHHTFGLVLRSRLRHQLQALPRGVDIEKVFGALDPIFGQAAGAFDETRRLSPDNVYGYITHIQMVLATARRLKDAAGADTIARVGADLPAIRSWLTDNLALAEQLLREAIYLYGTFEQSNQYLTECKADLDKLYGDLDSVVALWEVADASGKAGAGGRRALANAYLARNDRRWAGLDLAELRRVVDLMDANLRDVGRKDDDYQLWFNAFILLPEFDPDRALAQLALWSKRFPSWRVYYYAYVLNFTLWFERRTDDLGAYEQALDDCQRRHFGRRNSSGLWHGQSSGDSGLVPEGDLGGWDRELDFFANSSALRRVNGVIQGITGPQAGTLLIDGRVRAFFVPGRTFSSHRDENAHVNFYVGFSPSGLRAWSVQGGKAPGGDRAPHTIAPAGSETVPVKTPAIGESKKQARAASLARERVLTLAGELIVAKGKIGAKLTVAELEERLDAAFGVGRTIARVGIDNLEKALAENERYRIRVDGADRLVESREEVAEAGGIEEEDLAGQALGQISYYDERGKFGTIKGRDGKKYWFKREFILPSDRASASRPGPIVVFAPTHGDKGPVASGIKIQPEAILTPQGLLAPDKLISALSEFVVAELSAAPLPGLELSALTKRINATFLSDMRLPTRLGVKDLRGFISQIEGVTVAGKDAPIVRLSNEPAFGQLKPPTKNKQPKEKRLAATTAGEKPLLNAEQRAVRERTLELARSGVAKDKLLTLVQLGAILSKEFPGTTPLPRRLGYKTLSDFVRSISELQLDSSSPKEIRLSNPKASS